MIIIHNSPAVVVVVGAYADGVGAICWTTSISNGSAAL